MTDVPAATLTADGPVGRLTLERPQARNALSRAMADALEAALERLASMDEVRAVVVAGRGRSFCAGADIAEMPTLSPVEAETLSGRWQRIMDGFAALPQVTVAAVQGHALGGGLMLAIAQDLRVAEASARFGLPEVTLGFNPGYGIARLLDIAGGAHARDLMLTARVVDAAEAHHMGLVTRVVRLTMSPMHSPSNRASASRNTRRPIRSRAVSAALHTTMPPLLVPTRTTSRRSSKNSRSAISAACVSVVMPGRNA